MLQYKYLNNIKKVALAVLLSIFASNCCYASISAEEEAILTRYDSHFPWKTVTPEIRQKALKEAQESCNGANLAYSPLISRILVDFADSIKRLQL